MSSYIDIPIETDPDLLAQEAFEFLQANIAGWVPNDGNLDTIMIEALARMVAEARDVASAVPTDIFRYFGELAGIPPQEATFAQGSTDWTMVNNAGYTIPAGTQIGIVMSGNVTLGFETLADIVIPPGSTTALNVIVQAVETGAEYSNVTGTVQLLDNLDYVTSISLDGPTTGGIDAEPDDTYLVRLALRLQLLAPRPILSRDFAIFAQDIAGVARAVDLDGYNPFHNLLTVNESSLETDITGWSTGGGCTVARSTAQANHGTASLALTGTASGDAYATTGHKTIIPNNMYTVVAVSRAGTTARFTRVLINWLTSADAFISQSVGTQVQDINSGWTALSVTGKAPSNAAKCDVLVEVVATVNTEVHYFDKISFRHGTSTDWVIGGTPELSNERMVAVACVDSDGNAVGSTIKTAVDAYLQAARESTFIVNVIDPTYTTIDVNFTAVAVTGFLPADIKAAGEAALTDYLSPNNWGLPGISGDIPFAPQWINNTTIRYLELAQVLNNVTGLDYISSLTFRQGSDSFASTDIQIGGPVAMPQPGTMVGTVT